MLVLEVICLCAIALSPNSKCTHKRALSGQQRCGPLLGRYGINRSLPAFQIIDTMKDARGRIWSASGSSEAVTRGNEVFTAVSSKEAQMTETFLVAR
jgi:hypothetical protein